MNFLQDHSRHYLEMALRTDRRERLENPSGYGKRTGDCGDTVEFFLTIQNSVIRSVSFDTNGCINTNACCNTIARMVEGQSANKAWDVTPEAVIEYLETLPPSHFHCAELAVGALYLALANFQELSRSPWKKLYQG